MKSIYNCFGIYRITNKIDGKSYVGKTGMNFGDRWDCHRAQLNGGYHDNPHLQNAWSKYGAQNFEFEIIEEVTDVDTLNDLEMKYIAEYRAAGLCYNIHDGGDGGFLLGKHLSEETKRKIGEKNRVNMTGRKASEETRQKMSESQSARFATWTDEERAQWGAMMSEVASGYHWSDEAKANFSRLQRTRPNSARFTPDDIRNIRRLKSEGMKLRDLAEMYDTSESYISSIVHRRRWADID